MLVQSQRYSCWRNGLFVYGDIIRRGVFVLVWIVTKTCCTCVTVLVGRGWGGSSSLRGVVRGRGEEGRGYGRVGVVIMCLFKKRLLWLRSVWKHIVWLASMNWLLKLSMNNCWMMSLYDRSSLKNVGLDISTATAWHYPIWSFVANCPHIRIRV